MTANEGCLSDNVAGKAREEQKIKVFEIYGEVLEFLIKVSR